MIRPEGIRASKWQIAPPLPQAFQQDLDHYHPTLLQILYNRGLKDPGHIQAFLEGHYLESTDPFLLPDMDKAVDRIRQAIDADEMIVVYGDFDVDGITSTVLLTQALRGLGVERRRIRPYIPDRFSEGYGLNNQALSKIKEMGASLVITVDCGIRAIKEVMHAREIALDVIITDHHSLSAELPSSAAIINPKRPESTYPELMLAGVGIAYKLVQALYQEMPERASLDPDEFLDLVAVGTVADMAPLLGENRKLVIDGLQVLNNLKRPGLAALANVSGLKRGALSAESIGFGLGPRINAAGRLSHAYDAARLLAANNAPTAKQLARELNELNKRRQKITAELCAKAEEMIDPQEMVMVAADEDFAPGVVGLVASRIAEKSYRPAIILEKGSEVSRGSCRSIPEFHITDALDETADLLVRHGGHAQAAGLTIKNENLPLFREKMHEIAARELADVDLIPTLPVDAKMSLDDIDWALHETLSRLEPTGKDNPTPIFMSENVEVMSHRVVGQDGAHMQLRLSSSNGGYDQKIMPAIAFRQGAWANQLPQFIDIAYTINVNEWNGKRNLQLMVKDIRPNASE